MIKIMGVYQIRNIVNGKLYVGSSTDIHTRWQSHKCRLRRNKHRSPHLQQSWNMYGELNFSFEVIEVIADKKNILMREQYWIDKCMSALNSYGYNLSPVAGTTLGYKFSPESKARLSKANRGRITSEETKEKLRLIGLRRKHTPKEIEKMRIANTGKRHTLAARLKMSASRKGRICSEVTRAKMSLVRKGVPYAPDVLAQRRAKRLEMQIDFNNTSPQGNA